MKQIIFDCETLSMDGAAAYIDPPEPIAAPDLDAITPAKNLTDPIKIAANLNQRRADALEEWQAKTAAANIRYQDTLSRCALDWNLNRIVALCWHDGETMTSHVCQDEDQEKAALLAFWAATAYPCELIGFCVRTFDAPVLIQRSRYLDVPYRRLKLDRWGRGDVTDLRDILTFDDARYEAIMPRSLQMFCKRFGITEGAEDTATGSDVGALVAAGHWQAVEQHCRADVERCRALACRLGYVRARQTVTA